ncbi:MAG: Rieske (2Fe-2S) protein [Jatrophihabitantaceae bacterium]
MAEPELSRRSALRGSLVGLLGGVAGYLVARNSAAARAKRGTTAANAYGASTGESGRLLAPVADVPRGGGVILGTPPIVLTRTSTDEVHAFSAVCTHQGCTVDKVAGGSIDCPCHGSRFDASTGAVVSGPASRALPSIPVVVRAGSVYTT